jgi:hypothetical protein
MYKGQKLIKDVSTNTMAMIPEIKAAVPDILFVKYSTAISIAIHIRITLSMTPIFFFMLFIF